MKKILFIISILAFWFACAQQNDFLDIQKQIEKRIKDDKKQKEKQQLRDFRLISFHQQFSQAKLLQVLPNGNKIYSLPLDNMPCIVPDMSQFNTPNLADRSLTLKSNIPGRIPNPVIPYRIIPQGK